MNLIYDKNINKILFGVDFLSDFSEEQFDNLITLAEELIQKYGDQVIFDEWYEYLMNEVLDKNSAINFLIAFYNYGGHELKIKDPYPFLGLLFNMIGFSLDNEPKTDEENQLFDTFDSIYISLLINSGIISKDDYFYMKLFNDEKLKNSIANSKNIKVLN